PKDMGLLIQGIRENVPNISQAILSVHTQNDLGLATANALAAIENGVRQVECTINGIGERAGNAALEEIVMALQVRKAYFNPYFGRPAESEAPLMNIKTTEIYKTSCLVSQLTGMLVQPNKAIVGANAFAHESGIHQDGILKHRQTYEIMASTDIGLPENRIVLGKHSGRNAFRTRLQELGFDLNEADFNKAFIRFKEVADKKKEMSDWDLEAIVRDETQIQVESGFRLEYVQVTCGDYTCPTATITVVTPDGTIRTDAVVGVGPVDAVYQAINRLVQIPNQLIEFSVQSVTEGIDALGTVTIRLRYEEQIFSGQASDTDIVVAAAYAYMNALNRLYRQLQSSVDLQAVGS
nr:2-isopropylmalate synthase [Nostocaceae cyanobacterium]